MTAVSAVEFTLINEVNGQLSFIIDPTVFMTRVVWIYISSTSSLNTPITAFSAKLTINVECGLTSVKMMADPEVDYQKEQYVKRGSPAETFFSCKLFSVDFVGCPVE